MRIGDADLEWHGVAIAEDPSLESVLEMTQSEAYAPIHVHREAGLAHPLLLSCRAPGQTLRG